jgi:hypothetical protein
MESTEVRKSSFGGLGLFSLKRFEVDDVILVESPLLAIRGLVWEDMEAALSNSSVSSKMIHSGTKFPINLNSCANFDLNCHFACLLSLIVSLVWLMLFQHSGQEFKRAGHKMFLGIYTSAMLWSRAHTTGLKYRRWPSFLAFRMLCFLVAGDFLDQLRGPECCGWNVCKKWTGSNPTSHWFLIESATFQFTP